MRRSATHVLCAAITNPGRFSSAPPSITLVVLTVFDAFIIVLTLREQNRQRRLLSKE